MKFIFTLIICLLFIPACSQYAPNRNVNNVSNNNSAPTQPAELPKEVAEIVGQIKSLETKGRDMESLRTDSKMGECGQKMRELQLNSTVLQAKAEKLPRLYSTFLSPAAIELKMCVSCAKTAGEACSRVDSNILDMNKRISEN